MMKKRVFLYTYVGAIEDFQSRLNAKASQFKAELNCKDSFDASIRNHQLEIDLARSGRSNGYRYIADMNETVKEIHFIGTIQGIGEAMGKNVNRGLETIGLIMLGILLAPLTILYLLAFLVKPALFSAKQKMREDRLELFMTKYMGCISGNNFPKNDWIELPVIPPSEAIKTLRYADLPNNLRYLAYTKDGERRLEIFANDVGSYSYRFKKVSLFDEQELKYCKTYGYWDEIHGGHSFFADYELLFNDLKNEMIGYEEDRFY